MITPRHQQKMIWRIAVDVYLDECSFLIRSGWHWQEAERAARLILRETYAMLWADERPAVHLPARLITGKGPR